MKKITIKGVDENIYCETLQNGLAVYLYINKSFHNNYVTFTTKYGSIYNEFTKKGTNQLIKVPNGIAHFLEHKVFAQESDPQPEEYFAQNGGVCNAYTTFKNTTYLFSSTDKVSENVNYLLDFVQNLYLTDEAVESEKGIIIQEINMCNDRPTDLLYDKIRLNTIKNNPFRESIIGTVSEVKSISRELLEECYNSFYNPKNMFLVVTGNFDKDEMIKTIKENQQKKNFEKFVSPKLKKFKESDNIVKEYEVVSCNTNIPKLAYSIKIPISKFNIDQRKLSIYLFIIFNLLFGDTSKFDEDMKEKGIITNTLYYNLLNIDTHLVISLINSSENYEEIIKEIEKRTKNISFTEEEFKRKIKVLISNEIFSYENVEMINEMIIDNIIFDNRIETNIIDIIKSLTLDELNTIVEGIDFNNRSIVILKK